jgi:hypothetical protein
VGTASISGQLLVQLARFANLRLSDDRAEVLARALGPALARLRAIRPADYEQLAPASTFRVPLPPGVDTQT